MEVFWKKDGLLQRGQQRPTRVVFAKRSRKVVLAKDQWKPRPRRLVFGQRTRESGLCMAIIEVQREPKGKGSGKNTIRCCSRRNKRTDKVPGSSPKLKTSLRTKGWSWSNSWTVVQLVVAAKTSPKLRRDRRQRSAGEEGSGGVLDGKASTRATEQEKKC